MAERFYPMSTWDNDTLRIANVNTTRIVSARISVMMSDKPCDRLRKAWEDAGFETAADVARAFGWVESTSRSHSNVARGFDAEAAIKYARMLKVNPVCLLGLERYAKGAPVTAPEPTMDFIASVVSALTKIGQEAPLPEVVLQSLDEIVRKVSQAADENEAIRNDPGHLETVLRLLISQHRGPKH